MGNAVGSDTGARRRGLRACRVRPLLKVIQIPDQVSTAMEVTLHDQTECVVASRPTASCSTVANNSWPSAISAPTKASASASSLTATTVDVAV